MKVKIILLLITLLQFSSYAQSSSVSGYLLNKENGEPVIFANIGILNTNRGAVTNKEGYFDISFNETQIELKFSCIGYKDTTIKFTSSQENINIYLEEIVYELSEIIVDPYTYAERFILEAIKVKNEHNSEIRYYENDIYSKTSFSSGRLGIFGIIEAVSQIVFLAPDKHQEKLLAVSKPPNMKNVPYSAIAINQNCNLQRDYSEIGNFSIINPLNDNALDYYNFYLEKELNSISDTVTVITMEPKRGDIPLFEGELYFSDSHKLIEANLKGSAQTADALYDSLVFKQRFSSVDGKFSFPYFTSYSLLVNFSGLEFLFDVKINYTNYTVNDSLNKPIITSKNLITTEINPNIDIELQRKNYFKIPLTLEEKEYYEKMNRIFVDVSLVKKIFLFMFIDVPPLLGDMPANLFGFNISNFSNFYRFNKVEGNFLGVEKTFEFDNDITNYTRFGYSFAPNIVNFENDFIWKYYRVNIQTGIRTLGEFNIFKTFQTMRALFNHVDNFNYYNRKSVKFSASIPFSNHLEFTPAINFEKKQGMDNQTNFSIFSKDKSYKPNYNFSDYKNNYVSMGLAFSSNSNYEESLQKNLWGKSSIYLSGNVKYLDKELLNSSESLLSWEIYSKIYWEIINSIKANISVSYFNMRKSEHISQYRFTHRKQSISFENQGMSFITETLPFYTLEDYEYTLNNYIYVNSKINWFDFPKVLNFRMSFATIFSYLKSYTTPNEVIENTLDKELYEFGAGIEGISFFNFYVVSNNINPKDIMLRVEFKF